MTSKIEVQQQSEEHVDKLQTALLQSGHVLWVFTLAQFDVQI